jgi:hypothetical protein
MKKTKKITLSVIAIGLIVVFSILIYSSKKELTQDGFKCPESYATDDEYTKALNSFIQQELSNNPNITAQEIMEKRYNLLVANHCTNTVQNIKDKLPPDTGTTTSDMIQNELRDYNSGVTSSSDTK